MAKFLVTFKNEDREFLDDADVTALPDVPLRPEPTVQIVNLKDLPMIQRRVSPVDQSLTLREVKLARIRTAFEKAVDQFFDTLKTFC